MIMVIAYVTRGKQGNPEASTANLAGPDANEHANRIAPLVRT